MPPDHPRGQVLCFQLIVGVANHSAFLNNPGYGPDYLLMNYTSRHTYGVSVVILTNSGSIRLARSQLVAFCVPPTIPPCINTSLFCVFPSNTALAPLGLE